MLGCGRLRLSVGIDRDNDPPSNDTHTRYRNFGTSNKIYLFRKNFIFSRYVTEEGSGGLVKVSMEGPSIQENALTSFRVVSIESYAFILLNIVGSFSLLIPPVNHLNLLL